MHVTPLDTYLRHRVGQRVQAACLHTARPVMHESRRNVKRSKGSEASLACNKCADGEDSICICIVDPPMQGVRAADSPSSSCEL